MSSSVKWALWTTIKISLVKIFEGNTCGWTNIVKGILFAHRVSKHTSAKFSPFFPVYNREPTLPIDVKYNLYWREWKWTPFEQRNVWCRAYNCDLHRANIRQIAGENICWAQKKCRGYNRHHQVLKKIKVGEKVLLKNQRRIDRKGGKFSFKWFSYPQFIQCQIRTFAPQ